MYHPDSLRFTKTNLLVVLSQTFMMMQNGEVRLEKLKTFLLHLAMVEFTDIMDAKWQPYMKSEQNEEVILDSLVKFW